MALINCPECGRQVSDSAPACPSCGFPVAEKVAATSATPASSPGPGGAPGELLTEVRPSWWGFFWHLFFFFLIVPPLIAWWRRSSTVLRVYRERLTVERGLFSKCYRDFNPHDIRSVDVDQSFMQRMVGIGNITISTAATAEAVEQMHSIPDPKGVRELVLAQRGGR